MYLKIDVKVTMKINLLWNVAIQVNEEIKQLFLTNKRKVKIDNRGMIG